MGKYSVSLNQNEFSGSYVGSSPSVVANKALKHLVDKPQLNKKYKIYVKNKAGKIAAYNVTKQKLETPYVRKIGNSEITMNYVYNTEKIE